MQYALGMYILKEQKEAESHTRDIPLGLPQQALNPGDFVGYDHTEVIYLPNLGLAGCHSVFKAGLCGTRMPLSSQSSKITRNSRQQW